jgi:hypothetical protein
VRDFIIKLDRPRRLVFDFDAWDRVIDRFVPKDLPKGEDPVAWVINNLQITAREVPPLMWIGLLWEDSELSEPQLRTMLNLAIREGRETMMSAMFTTVQALTSQAGVEVPDGEGRPPDEPGERKKGRAPKPTIPGSRKKGA